MPEPLFMTFDQSPDNPNAVVIKTNDLQVYGKTPFVRRTSSKQVFGSIDIVSNNGFQYLELALKNTPKVYTFVLGFDGIERGHFPVSKVNGVVPESLEDLEAKLIALLLP